MELFESLEKVKIGSMSVSTILSAVVVFVICLIAIKLLCKAFDRLLDKSKKLDRSLASFLRSAIKVALWVVATPIIADALGIPMSSLVAVVSVAGLALSLSIQGLLTNLFSGVTLLATRPFAVGDYIEVGANAGIVDKIGLFHTVIISLDNKVIHIPNGDITSASIVNYSSEELRRVDMSFNASYDCATSDVRRAIFEAIGEDSRILSEPEPFTSILSYGSSSVEYVVRVWCKSSDYWSVFFALNESVRESFARNGIEMTYDHLNVHIEGE